MLWSPDRIQDDHRSAGNLITNHMISWGYTSWTCVLRSANHLINDFMIIRLQNNWSKDIWLYDRRAAGYQMRSTDLEVMFRLCMKDVTNVNVWLCIDHKRHNRQFLKKKRQKYKSIRPGSYHPLIDWFINRWFINSLINWSIISLLGEQFLKKDFLPSKTRFYLKREENHFILCLLNTLFLHTCVSKY